MGNTDKASWKVHCSVFGVFAVTWAVAMLGDPILDGEGDLEVRMASGLGSTEQRHKR